VAQGSPVNLVISSGPEIVAMPNVEGHGLGRRDLSDHDSDPFVVRENDDVYQGRLMITHRGLSMHETHSGDGHSRTAIQWLPAR
jgi:hypothetical protein